jgi:hypothetical protein
MRQRDRSDGTFPRSPCQKLVPRGAGSHLDRLSAPGRKILYVHAAHRTWNPMPPTCGSNEPFVGIAASAAQTMIEMRRHQLPFVRLREATQDFEQHHRVDPTRHRHKDRLSGPKQAAFGNGSINSQQQVGHGMDPRTLVLCGKGFGAAGDGQAARVESCSLRFIRPNSTWTKSPSDSIALRP